MSNDKQPTVLPRHREAAYQALNEVMTNWTKNEEGEVVAAIIAANDPHAAADATTLRLFPVPDKQGVLFGTAWVSYDRLTGYEGEDGPDRDAFYSKNIIARGILDWANRTRAHLAKLRGEGGAT
jgi:hypothetical protein